eukprot:137613-Hanusia_phi.AAC.5
MICKNSAGGCGMAWHVRCLAENPSKAGDWICSGCRNKNVTEMESSNPKVGYNNESQGMSDSPVQNKVDNNATIGEGIVISGGRVIMQGGNITQDNAASCRLENEARKSKAKTSPISSPPPKPIVEKRPILSGPKSINPMDQLRDILISVMRMPEAEIFKNINSLRKEFKRPPSDGQPLDLNDLSAILRKICSNEYKSVNHARDDILRVWNTTLTCNGATSTLYQKAKRIAKEFDSKFECEMDMVRGLGGRADLGFFEHGARCCRIGQEVKVYWPEEHKRIKALIDDYDQVDQNTHLYHLLYEDENEQWTVLPHKNIELVGWVSPEEEVFVSSQGLRIISSTSAAANKENLKRKANDHDGVSDSKKDTQDIDCPSFKEEQEVEMCPKSSISSDPKIYRKGKITRINGDGTYDIVLHDEKRIEKGVPDECLKAPEGKLGHQDLLQLVQELRRKAQYDFFDHPVDEKHVPGYYHPNPAARQRGMTAWHTQVRLAKRKS